MITKDSTLKQIIEVEGADNILLKNNIPCLLCPMMKQEMNQLTIGNVCEMYGIKLDEILKKLNK